MRKFLTSLSAAFALSAFLATAAQAQVVKGDLGNLKSGGVPECNTSQMEKPMDIANIEAIEQTQSIYDLLIQLDATENSPEIIVQLQSSLSSYGIYTYDRPNDQDNIETALLKFFYCEGLGAFMNEKKYPNIQEFVKKSPLYSSIKKYFLPTPKPQSTLIQAYK